MSRRCWLCDGGDGVRCVKSVKDERAVLCAGGCLERVRGSVGSASFVCSRPRKWLALWRREWVNRPSAEVVRDCGTCGLKYLGPERNSSRQ
jgi:hypothetical protein